MSRVLRSLTFKFLVAEIVAALWLGAVADYWSHAAGRRLGKFSGKLSEGDVKEFGGRK